MPLVLYCKTQMGLIQECKSDVVIDDNALSFQSVLDEKNRENKFNSVSHGLLCKGKISFT